MRPPTIAEWAMGARIFPENLQAGVAITRGRNELQEFQHLTGCDGLPFCSCIEAAIRRRYPDELASLTEDAVCGALYSWVMAEFDDSPEGRVFVAEMEEMRARRQTYPAERPAGRGSALGTRGRLPRRLDAGQAMKPKRCQLRQASADMLLPAGGPRAIKLRVLEGQRETIRFARWSAFEGFNLPTRAGKDFVNGAGPGTPTAEVIFANAA